jgi:hypothetical protein
MATSHRDALRSAALGPGTALLVTGPAMSGKRALVIDLLTGERTTGEPATVAVTTRRSAAAFERDYVAAGGDADGLAVVDCVTRLGGFERVSDGPTRRYVSDPGDLTGVGIGATELLRAADGRGATPWLGIHSLSTMTMYATVDRVFRFLHVLSGRVRALGGVLVAAVEGAGDGDDHTLDVLSQPFDGRLDVRERDDGTREVRGRGVSVAPRAWTPLAERNA